MFEGMAIDDSPWCLIKVGQIAASPSSLFHHFPELVKKNCWKQVIMPMKGDLPMVTSSL